MSKVPLNHLLKIGGDTLNTTAQTLSGAVNELKSGKQNNLTFDDAPTQNSDNPVKSGGIFTAIANAIASISQAFSGLTDVDIDDQTLADGQVPTYDALTEKWENKPLPQGGHIMLPVPSALLTASQLVAQVDGSNNTNDNVPSLWGMKTWSNCDVLTLFTTVPKDADTVGTWVDGDAWKNEGASRVGWLWHSAFHGILSDDDVEISFVFDNSTEEVVSVYAYRVDDDVTHDGVAGGAIAFKLNYPIQHASGVKLGVKLTRQRTQVSNLTVLS